VNGISFYSLVNIAQRQLVVLDLYKQLENASSLLKNIIST